MQCEGDRTRAVVAGVGEAAVAAAIDVGRVDDRVRGGDHLLDDLGGTGRRGHGAVGVERRPAAGLTTRIGHLLGDVLAQHQALGVGDDAVGREVVRRLEALDVLQRGGAVLPVDLGRVPVDREVALQNAYVVALHPRAQDAVAEVGGAAGPLDRR